jgi:uncharacterized protein with GYD domain
MATYLVLGNFTDQGIHNVKETTKRAEAVRGLAKKVGANISEFYWLLGEYDVACVVDAPDEAAITALGLSIGALGNVRTQCLRAFKTDEISKILGKMPS